VITATALDRAGRVLATESARYAAAGWMQGTSGNLSVVLHREPLRLAVTTSGRDKATLAPDDVVAVDERGTAVADQPHPDRVPSAEAGLHARIAAVAGAGAVVHVHVLAAVLAAERWPEGVPLSDLEMLKGLGRRAHGDLVVVPVIPNAQDMVALGDAFETGFDPATPAVILARHGLYVWGEDLQHARTRTECLEWLLRFVTALPTYATDAGREPLVDHASPDPGEVP
jgi:methylthioribulose-1-phosphate dehydratase